MQSYIPSKATPGDTEIQYIKRQHEGHRDKYVQGQYHEIQRYHAFTGNTRSKDIHIFISITRRHMRYNILKGNTVRHTDTIYSAATPGRTEIHIFRGIIRRPSNTFFQRQQEGALRYIYSEATRRSIEIHTFRGNNRRRRDKIHCKKSKDYLPQQSGSMHQAGLTEYMTFHWHVCTSQII